MVQHGDERADQGAVLALRHETLQMRLDADAQALVQRALALGQLVGRDRCEAHRGLQLRWLERGSGSSVFAICRELGDVPASTLHHFCTPAAPSSNQASS